MDAWSESQQREHNLRSFRQVSVFPVEPAVRSQSRVSRACVRCAVVRQVSARSSPLCRDCRFVLSREEVALWAA